MVEQMSVCVEKNKVAFVATGIANNWANKQGLHERACTVVDTQDWLIPNTMTRAELLETFGQPLDYRIILRSAGQSYLIFSAKVTPGQVVSIWYLMSDTHEAREAEKIIKKLRLPVEKRLIARDLDTFMATEDTKANKDDKERIRALQDHAYKWAAHVAMTSLEVGLCSHESKQPPTLQPPTLEADWTEHMFLAPVIMANVMDSGC